jgi:hypothetical protein
MPPTLSKTSPWRGRLVLVASILAIVLLAAHPELRLFVPFLDAIGLDVFVMLVGAQLWQYAGPLLQRLHVDLGLPVAWKIYAIGIWLLGMMGPFVHAWVSERLRSAGARATA